MNQYIVHLFREMRLTYTDIEADTPQAAAAITHDKQTEDADNVEDCDGEDLSALVDVAGDEDYSQSVTIDFEPERQRLVAPKLLNSLKNVLGAYCYWLPRYGDKEAVNSLMVKNAQIAIAEAEAIGIPPHPAPAAPPARFEIEHDPQENPDRAYVLVDGKFDVAIVRTPEGIVIDVYPKDWIDPIATMTVWDEQVAELEQDAAEGE